MQEWQEIIVRSVVMLVGLFLVTKLTGKRQISQLTFFEYITGITIGSIAAEVTTVPETKIINGLIGMFIWGIVPFLAGILAMKSVKIREILNGKPTIFIKDGKVMEDNLKKEKYTVEEMSGLLRNKNIFNLADVEFAVLESDGSLNALLKKDNQPLTRKDLNLPSINEKEPHTVIVDGEILDESLRTSGKTKLWLEEQLQAMNVTVENVFIGQINPYGELYIDIYDDLMQIPTNQERPLLHATLKKLQAELEQFSLATDSPQAKEMYKRNARTVQKIIDKSTVYLKA